MLARACLAALMIIGTAPVLADENPASMAPAGYKLVWSDEFTTLSLRTGGWTYAGLASGSGTWSAPGAYYESDPRGIEGYGFDWFINPTYDRWPAAYPTHGQFAITSEGLRIRSEAPWPSMVPILPRLARHRNAVPWMSGQMNSFHAVRIRPPFYFEARAKMPRGVGRPWPAIWLVTGAHRPYPNDYGREYEIDVHEGFGDSDRLHAAIHWNPSATSHDFPTRGVVDKLAGVDLSAGFNTWGCQVSRDRQVFFFNGAEVGRVETPGSADIDQPFGIILDVSAGIPWSGGGPPSNGPHDMVVRYVRLYAQDPRVLTLR
jgi:hypothetical protein